MEEIGDELRVLKAMSDFHITSKALLDYLEYNKFEITEEVKENIRLHMEASVDVHALPLYFVEQRNQWRNQAIILGACFVVAVLYIIFK